MTLSSLGHPNEYTIRIKESSWGEIVRVVVWRAVHFLIDWVLVRIVAPWSYSFFLERPGSPVLWRWRVGFRDSEVYVRVSRGWGKEDLLGASKEDDKRGGDSPFFKVRILPALDKERVRAKTGYLLMDGDWDLDFAVMTEVTRLVDKGVLQEEQLEKSVLVWCGDEEEGQGQWVIWECWKLDEGAEAEQRKKIIVFKVSLQFLFLLVEHWCLSRIFNCHIGNLTVHSHRTALRRWARSLYFSDGSKSFNTRAANPVASLPNAKFWQQKRRSNYSPRMV